MGTIFMPLRRYMIYKDGASINQATQACKIPEGLPLECNPIPCTVCGGMPRFIRKEEVVRKATKGWHYVLHQCDMKESRIKLCPFIKEAIRMIKADRSSTSAIAITKWNACQRYIAKLAERIV